MSRNPYIYTLILAPFPILKVWKNGSIMRVYIYSHNRPVSHTEGMGKRVYLMDLLYIQMGLFCSVNFPFTLS